MNPFSALSAHVPPLAIQIYVLVMAALTIGGTLFDIWHKRSAAYFFADRRKSRANAPRPPGPGTTVSLAFKTAAEALISGEFCNAGRRIAHLLAMYGFIVYLATTIVMVFWYAAPGAHTPPLLPLLWHIGALAICIGGYWFWFFIRVDVAAEGHSPFRLVRADLFILSLVASATLALMWSWLETGGSAWANIFLGLYLIATTVLFGSVPWSKFAHMFYKPAAAFQRRIEDANGARRNLPKPADKPEIFGSAHESPRHY